MPAFNTPEDAARFLADIKLDILDTRKGTFSPHHLDYTVSLIRPTDPRGYITHFQSNPEVHGQPTVTQIMQSVLEDSRMPEEYDIDDFADALNFSKPSEAIKAYEQCNKAHEWVTQTLHLSRSETGDLIDQLNDDEEGIEEAVKAIQSDIADKQAHEHPPVDFTVDGHTYVTIDTILSNLDTGELGDRVGDYGGYIGDAFTEIADGGVDVYTHNLIDWLSDHTEWFERAYDDGLFEGCGGDIDKMIGMAQYEYYRNDLEDHQSDIIAYATFETLKDAGAYAIDSETADAICEQIASECNDHERFDDFDEIASTAINDSLEEILGDDMGDEIHEALKEYDYGKPNPVIMGKEAVRQINAKGYDAAMAESWKDLLGKTTPSLTQTAEASRAASTNLAQDGERQTTPDQAQEK